MSNPADLDHADTFVQSLDQRVEVRSTALTNLGFNDRYESRHVLAEGGMGQVLVASDRQIGREIALKRIRADRGDQSAGRVRFVREARVQGQLEHPAIVPVYDLGVDDAGEAWFTMKKVHGATLSTIIARLRAGDPNAAAEISQRRLLTAFSSVCLAIDFAHARGVIHRDLKPDNIMLGDFGEVYVLDWGIARIDGAIELAAPQQQRAPSHDDASTVDGEVVGTLGYMAPEQLLGDLERLGPCSDIWALGAILFELLALEPLRPRQMLGEAIAEADLEIDARPSVRAPHLDIAPELDAICQRAIARDPAARHASARELNHAVERYLDGDRDLQRRRELASAHLARAQVAAAHAQAGGPEALAVRVTAMHEISRALLLDPSREEATRAMMRLLIEPPAELPPEAREELRASSRDAGRVAGRVGGIGLLAWYLFLPLYAWMGIRDWSLTVLVLGLIAVAAGFSFASARWPQHGHALLLGVLYTSAILVAVLTRVVGPLASAPMLALGLAVAAVLHPAGARISEVVGFIVIALVAPMALEATGVISPSYEFAGGTLTVLPHMTALPATPTQITLTLTSVGTTVALCIYLVSLRDTLRAAQERLHLYSWNLRQFMPVAIPSRLDRESTGG